jgi:adenine-specific DNA methylase
MKLLMERFADWQKRGFLPNRKIEPGAETSRLAREKGWTYWHQLFTPRELLVAGLFNELAASRRSAVEIVGCGLALGRSLNYLSRLSMWHAGAGNEKVDRVFVNQALNTYYSYAGRAWPALRDNFIFDIQGVALNYRGQVAPKDGRAVEALCDLWVTDPPYADAVCYEEISEFFLVWYQPCLSLAFPKWAIDSKRALAVKGNDENFVKSMVDCYRRLRENMPDDGLQVVMFTHQDASVWADLALILWAAGLRVTAAWCIATETESSLKEGNYVQGTVLLVLRKQTSEDTAFLDEVYQEVEAEVRRQLDTMRALDDAKDPNFTDTDYPLAAYAAALRVLTSKAIPEINVAYELTRTRKKDEKSEVEKVIDRAVEIAWDHLVPRGVDRQLWKTLEPAERFFIKGLEMESHGERRLGPFQDMAKGLRFGEYQRLLASTKPNETRLKTATEFGSREMSGSAASPGGFGASLVRHALFAACKTRETESPRDGITWLTTEVKDYAASRQRVIEILEFLAALRQNASLPHWHKDAEAAGLLAGALRNRQDNV